MTRIILIVVLVALVSLSQSSSENEAGVERADRSGGSGYPQCKRDDPYDHWAVQTVSCDIKCENPWDTSCRLSVPVDACRCQTGYVRQSNGYCVPKNYCPPQRG